MIRRPARSTLFTDTTLFRSRELQRLVALVRVGEDERAAQHLPRERRGGRFLELREDRKSTRLNSSHANISYAVFCLKKKTWSAFACCEQRPGSPITCHIGTV